MKNFAFALLITVTTLASPSAFSVDQTSGQKAVELAQKEVLRQRAIDYAMAPIKSQADLQSYLLSKPSNSPFNQLSPGALNRFVASVEFNENGVTTYDYSDLRSELSAKQIYQVLSLLGIQDTSSSIPGLNVKDEADLAVSTASALDGAAPSGISPTAVVDYKDYSCVSRGSCMKSPGYICTSNC